MTENDIGRLKVLRFRPGDTVLVTLRSNVPPRMLHEVSQTLEEFSNDNNVRVLVFKEETLGDLTTLSLHDLLKLQGRLEAAVIEISKRDALEI